MHISAAFLIPMLLVTATYPQTTPSTAKAATPHAKWSSLVAAVLSVPSEEAFNKSGLYKLTPDELGSLMADADYMPRMNYTCGSMRSTAQDYEKIRVMVHFSDATPVEIQSAILQKLRAISDLVIVYGRNEADKVVNIIGFEDKGKNDARLGFTLSMVVTDPCTAAYSKSAVFTVDNMQDFAMFTGGNIEAVAAPAVAALDAREFENARKENASMKKIIQSK